MSNIFIAPPVALTLHVWFTALAKCHPHYHVVKGIIFWPWFQTTSQINTKAGRKKIQRERNRGIEVGLGFTHSGLCLKAV